MAYPTVDAPYGLKPINLIGGQVFAGSTRMMEIASGYSTSIFYGDIVKRVVGGTIERDAGTTSATPCGVFLGVSFTNSSTGQIQQQQFYPASQAIKSGTKIFAVVADDPDTLFQVAVTTSGSVMSTVTQNAIGTNMTIVSGTGSVITGNSGLSVLNTSPASTNTLPIRVIDVIPATATSSTTYCELVVKINATMHQYNNILGLAYA